VLIEHFVVFDIEIFLDLSLELLDCINPRLAILSKTLFFLLSFFLFIAILVLLIFLGVLLVMLLNYSSILIDLCFPVFLGLPLKIGVIIVVLFILSGSWLLDVKELRMPCLSHEGRLLRQELDMP